MLMLQKSAHAPRLAPIQRSPSLLVWLLGRIFRWKLGKVITPHAVMYTRMPRLVFPQMAMYRLLDSGLQLDRRLVHLVQTFVSLQNDCAFCTDLHESVALHEGITREQLRALPDFAHSKVFSPKERAALAYAREARANAAPSDSTFAALHEHFDEREVVELTWLCAFVAYLNTMAKALGIGSDGFCASNVSACNGDNDKR